MHKLLIFDWDGTLVDSSEHIVQCIKVACSATNEDFPGREAASSIIGLGMHEALTELFGKRDKDFVDAFRHAYSEHFFSITPSRRDLFPGVMDMLEHFRAEGFSMAVATGKSRQGMDYALQSMGLENWFEGVRCADEAKSKPDPQMLRELLQEFDFGADQAIMIGDTEYDMDMAHRINMKRIAVSYGVHDVERMRTYELGGIADHPLDIIDIVAALTSKKNSA